MRWHVGISPMRRRATGYFFTRRRTGQANRLCRQNLNGAELMLHAFSVTESV